VQRATSVLPRGARALVPWCSWSRRRGQRDMVGAARSGRRSGETRRRRDHERGDTQRHHPDPRGDDRRLSPIRPPMGRAYRLQSGVLTGGRMPAWRASAHLVGLALRAHHRLQPGRPGGGRVIVSGTGPVGAGRPCPDDAETRRGGASRSLRRRCRAGLRSTMWCGPACTSPRPRCGRRRQCARRAPRHVRPAATMVVVRDSWTRWKVEIEAEASCPKRRALDGGGDDVGAAQIATIPDSMRSSRN